MTHSIDLKKTINMFDGSPVMKDESESLTVGDAFSTILLSYKTDPLRAFNLAQKAYADESVDLDDSTRDYVKAAIKNAGTLPNGFNSLVLGQLLALFN